MRSPIRFAAAFLLAAAATFGAGRAEAANPKIIIVDIRRAVLDTEEGLRVQASLKRLFDVRQRELSDLERQFQQKQQAVQQKVQAGTPQSQLTKELEDLQRLYVDVTGRRDSYQNEMASREQQLTGPIYQRILGLVRKIAIAQGADLIVDKNFAPFYKSELEVTDRAIQMYNSGEASNLTGPPVLAPTGATPPASTTPKPATTTPKPAPGAK